MFLDLAESFIVIDRSCVVSHLTPGSLDLAVSGTGVNVEDIRPESPTPHLQILSNRRRHQLHLNHTRPQEHGLHSRENYSHYPKLLFLLVIHPTYPPNSSTFPSHNQLLKGLSFEKPAQICCTRP
ncbi:uncharacterized protein CLUP02_06427 [Colletotrichum lupini]|uniref:Uncharacterized protein n=1 Tax=Colletotrichum lupini TaxID=145971 RepID=A0A9Q8SP65_9PEZI|nr:uncharacterized protein CLUP02_06427 [Colletotrichum lupini]UQC80941.1 hypothetical protein CLUP02_06427 [Colletotrichum lupini]